MKLRLLPKYVQHKRSEKDRIKDHDVLVYTVEQALVVCIEKNGDNFVSLSGESLDGSLKGLKDVSDRNEIDYFTHGLSGPKPVSLNILASDRKGVSTMRKPTINRLINETFKELVENKGKEIEKHLRLSITLTFNVVYKLWAIILCYMFDIC